MSSNSSSVSFLGLNSSFDSASLVSQLIAVETQNRIAPLTKKNTTLTQEKTGLSTVSTLVGSLKTTLAYDGVKDGTSPLAPKKVTSSDTSSEYVSVTATDSAANQNFNISVTKLATNTIRKSDTSIKTDLTNASAISAAHFKAEVTLSDGTVTVNGVTQTYTADGTPTISDLETFLSSFAGVTATYNTTSGKFDLTGITSLGSSGDTSNMLSALGLNNSPISGGNVSGIQNLEAVKDSTKLNAIGITGTKITINGTDIAIDTTATGTTIDGLVTKINNTAGAKVSAAFDNLNGKLILTNAGTGALSITLTGDGNISALNLNNPSSETLGDNAEFSISTLNNGATLVSNSNSVTGLVDGLTFDLKKITTSPVSVNITSDSSGYATKLNSVITQVNKLLTNLYTKDDSFSRNMISKIKSTMAGISGVTGVDTHTSFIELGLKSTLDASGKFAGYSLTSDTFTAAYLAAPDEVNKVLWGNSSDAESIFASQSNGDKGILVKLQDILDDYVDPSVATNGLINQVQSSIDSQIKSNTAKIAREQASIDSYEKRMKAQFAQLDTINAQYKSQQAAVASLSNTSNS